MSENGLYKKQWLNKSGCYCIVWNKVKGFGYMNHFKNTKSMQGLKMVGQFGEEDEYGQA